MATIREPVPKKTKLRVPEPSHVYSASYKLAAILKTHTFAFLYWNSHQTAWNKSGI